MSPRNGWRIQDRLDTLAMFDVYPNTERGIRVCIEALVERLKTKVAVAELLSINSAHLSNLHKRRASPTLREALLRNGLIEPRNKGKVRVAVWATPEQRERFNKLVKESGLSRRDYLERIINIMETLNE